MSTHLIRASLLKRFPQLSCLDFFRCLRLVRLVCLLQHLEAEGALKRALTKGACASQAAWAVSGQKRAATIAEKRVRALSEAALEEEELGNVPVGSEQDSGEYAAGGASSFCRVRGFGGANFRPFT